jgi:hypothetical protein
MSTHNPLEEWRPKGVAPYWCGDVRPDIEAQHIRLVQQQEQANRDWISRQQSTSSGDAKV